MILPVKEILEQFCSDYQKMLQNKEGFPRECVFDTDIAQTTMSDEQYRLYQGTARIKLDNLPVYVEHFLHRDPETAINKACFRLFNNLFFYGLESAHRDLQKALAGEDPFKLTVNFGKP